MKKVIDKAAVEEAVDPATEAGPIEPAPLKFKRISPGYYTYGDKITITRTENGKEWYASLSRPTGSPNTSHESDPVSTLKEAKQDAIELLKTETKAAAEYKAEFDAETERYARNAEKAAAKPRDLEAEAEARDIWATLGGYYDVDQQVEAIEKNFADDPEMRDYLLGEMAERGFMDTEADINDELEFEDKVEWYEDMDPGEFKEHIANEKPAMRKRILKYLGREEGMAQGGLNPANNLKSAITGAYKYVTASPKNISNIATVVGDRRTPAERLLAGEVSINPLRWALPHMETAKRIEGISDVKALFSHNFSFGETLAKMDKLYKRPLFCSSTCHARCTWSLRRVKTHLYAWHGYASEAN